jgi:hypothetical protein
LILFEMPRLNEEQVVEDLRTVRVRRDAPRPPVSSSVLMALGLASFGAAFLMMFYGLTQSIWGATHALTLVDGLASVSCASSSHCWTVGDHDNGNVLQTLIQEYSLTIPPLTSVVSRMTQGVAAFDINLPLTGTPAVECRIGVGGVSGNYSLVFSFVNNLTSVAKISTSNGSVSAAEARNIA